MPGHTTGAPGQPHPRLVHLSATVTLGQGTSQFSCSILIPVVSRGSEGRHICFLSVMDGEVPFHVGRSRTASALSGRTGESEPDPSELDVGGE